MKKYIAKVLRRAANELDPKPEPWVALMPHYTYGSSAANTNPVFTWHQVNQKFDPEAAGRRAVRKHGRALRLLGMN